MYKVGDKFIIEIDSVMTNKKGTLYGIKGFNSLVFDEKGLDRLTSYSEEFDNNEETIADAEKYGYDKGLSDGWESAKKIGLSKINGGIGFDSVEEIFGTTDTGELLKSLSPQEAVEKLKAWEEKQEIKVGDVVNYGISNRTLIVTRIYDGDATFDAVTVNGEGFTDRNLSDCKKTGKHIDLTEIFKGLEGEDDV